MRAKTINLIVLLGCVLFVLPLIAQHGHPLVGSWHGAWGPTPAHRNDVTVIMEFDGDNVTGMLNPGPESVRLQTVTLNPTNWTVHFEADTKDRAGNVVRFIADGKLEDLGSPTRSIAGTWNHGTVKGDFKITRDH